MARSVRAEGRVGRAQAGQGARTRRAHDEEVELVPPAFDVGEKLVRAGGHHASRRQRAGHGHVGG
eukprot:1976887-Rhodomonas_salina.1